MHLHHVTNTKTNQQWDLLANTVEEAIQIIARTFIMIQKSDLTAEELTTTEGYRVTWLRALPKDTYFWKVNKKSMTTQTVPYVKGNYDRSMQGYECHRFYDICDFQTLKGDILVTTDVTF